MAVLLSVMGLLVILWLASKLLSVIKKNNQPEEEAAAVDYDWHTLSVAQALHKQETQLNSGLSHAEVANRQEYYGFNRLDEKPPESALHLLLSQFKGVLIVVLIMAAILAAVIGNITDGVVILIVVIINAGLGFYQEFQANKSLAALKKMLALKAKVRRDKQIYELSAEQLVPGDIVILNAGDKIPADGRIVAASSLEV
ncbi:MAG: cation-transporting P-type ATPase, partial [Methylococcales bacterium]|nr:cation-transporting P-type ATPase [Methylococcales bacterium]